MIPVQDIVNLAKGALDSEGSGRYEFDLDFKPAINFAIDWIESVFNRVFSENKLSEEALADLVKVKIFQTNQFSRVKLDEVQIGHKAWSILAVYPEPEVYPAAQPQPQVRPETSVYRPDLSFVKSYRYASRLTLEQRNKNRKNTFMPGNETLTGELRSYGYISSMDYSSSNYTQKNEIEVVGPDTAGKFVGISYLKRPNRVNELTDQIEFSTTLQNLVLEKMLNFMSYKQGDKTSLYAVTEADIRKLLQLMV